jgi:hypothetical protein
MVRVTSFLIVYLCGSLSTITAQNDSIRKVYVQPFPDKFFIWPVVKKRELTFTISNRFDESLKQNYKPNNAFAAGFGVYIFEVAAELTFAVPLGERSRNTYGASEVRDLQANFLGKYWGADLYRQNYSGFYVPNPNQTPALPDEFIKRSDIELINTGINGVYAFNKSKYSLKSSYNYAERQLKSAGSFIVSGSLNSLSLQADSSVLSQIYSPLLSAVSTFRSFNYTGFSIAPGYTYSLVYKSFFLNGIFSYGPAHYWIKYTGKDQSIRHDISINTVADIRVAIGYNSDRIFGGLSYRAQTNDIRFEDIKFTNASSTLKFLVGYRFHEIGILRRRAKDYIPIN